MPSLEERRNLLQHQVDVPVDNANDDNDDALLIKPVTTKKRSLASLLSIDNNYLNEDMNANTNTDRPSTNTGTAKGKAIGTSSKRRKLCVDSKWEVKEHQIPELPFLYLKERTSVVVMNEDPQCIASRIVHCAKKLHVYGQYSTQKAQATLTLDDMQFSIQLFKVPESDTTSINSSTNKKEPNHNNKSSNSNSSDKSNNCIIVELQRKNGSSIQFHKTARTLLQAAKKAKAVTNTNTNDSNENPSIAVADMAMSSISPYSHSQQQQEAVFSHTLDVVDALLKKDRIDANLLGMESLQLLTSHQSASDAMVRFASSVVVSGEQFEDIKGTILSLIQNKIGANNNISQSGSYVYVYNTSGTETDSDSDNEGEDRAEDKDEYCQKMHTCALSILSNSLKNVNVIDNDVNKTAVESIGEHLLSSLLDHIKSENATIHPQNAYFACKCLEEVLLNSSSLSSTIDVRYRASKLDIYNIITSSHNIGKASYPLLQSATEKVLKILGEAKETTTK